MTDPKAAKEASSSAIRTELVQLLEQLLTEAEGNQLDDMALKNHVFESVNNYIYSTATMTEWCNNRAIVRMLETLEKSVTAQSLDDVLTAPSSEASLSWGSPGLDLLMGDLKPGERVLLCGKSGSGKTALLQSLVCEHMRSNKSQQRPLGWINLNMPHEEFSRRMVSVLLDVPLHGKEWLTNARLDALCEMSESLIDTPVWYMHEPTLCSSQLLEVGSLWVQRFGIKVLVIDGYPMPHVLDERRTEKLDLFHSVTFELAREYDLRIIMTCQLPAGFEEWNAPSLRYFAGPSKILPERLLLIRADPGKNIVLESIDNLHDPDKAVPLLQNHQTLALREP